MGQIEWDLKIKVGHVSRVYKCIELELIAKVV